ncbi:hypothetical protein BGZ97_011247, partial [Linnemannia gamsii]
GLDKELAMKYACPRWLESVDGQPAVEKQNKEFEGKFLPALAERLSAVLSADAKTSADRFNITVKDIGVIQNMCGFEISMHNTEKTWCRLLGLGLPSSSKGDGHGNGGKERKHFRDDKDDEDEDGEDDDDDDDDEDEGNADAAKEVFLKLEIADDLDDFYTYGPGVPFNRQLGCKL